MFNPWSLWFKFDWVAFYMPYTNATCFLRDIHKDMMYVPNIPGC